jgi:hypothetical protein
MASAAWQRRNERARALGYRNYYDYRMHGYGATAPGVPPARGTEGEILRGHRGPAALRRFMQRRNVVQVLGWWHGPRDPSGQFRAIQYVVIWEDREGRPHEMSFIVRGRMATRQGVDDMSRDLEAQGIQFTPPPPSPPKRRLKRKPGPKRRPPAMARRPGQKPRPRRRRRSVPTRPEEPALPAIEVPEGPEVPEAPEAPEVEAPEVRPPKPKAPRGPRAPKAPKRAPKAPKRRPRRPKG